MPAYLNGKQVAAVKQMGQYDLYSGPYTVDPLAASNVTLPTAQKVLENNVTVYQIRFEEVSNNFGGNTVYIGR